MINTATCNATDTTGCAAAPPSMQSAHPGPPVFNPATQTLYLSYGTKANRIAVVNAATCNAPDITGCGQVPAVVKVGQVTADLAVSTKSRHRLRPSAGPGFTRGHGFADQRLDLQRHPPFRLRPPRLHRQGRAQPEGIAVNDRTHTAYVANNADGDSPGTVSVINTATCNGTRTTGCRRRFPMMAVGMRPS